MATKLGRMIASLDGLLPIMSHYPLITRPCEIRGSLTGRGSARKHLRRHRLLVLSFLSYFQNHLRFYLVSGIMGIYCTLDMLSLHSSECVSKLVDLAVGRLKEKIADNVFKIKVSFHKFRIQIINFYSYNVKCFFNKHFLIKDKKVIIRCTTIEDNFKDTRNPLKS